MLPIIPSHTVFGIALALRDKSRLPLDNLGICAYTNCAVGVRFAKQHTNGQQDLGDTFRRYPPPANAYEIIG